MRKTNIIRLIVKPKSIKIEEKTFYVTKRKIINNNFFCFLIKQTLNHRTNTENDKNIEEEFIDEFIKYCIAIVELLLFRLKNRKRTNTFVTAVR